MGGRANGNLDALVNEIGSVGDASDDVDDVDDVSGDIDAENFSGIERKEGIAYLYDDTQSERADKRWNERSLPVLRYYFGITTVPFETLFQIVWPYGGFNASSVLPNFAKTDFKPSK
jgi:hypothetical protein